MSAMELLNYPGSWTWLAIVAVLMGGLVVFAVVLRRILRTPPLDAQRPASSSPPASSPTPAPTAPAASAPSANKHP